MRKFVVSSLAVVAIAVGGFVVNACNQGTIQLEQSLGTTKKLENKYEWIGEFHNDGLMYCLHKAEQNNLIASLPQNPNEARSKIFSFIDKSTLEYSTNSEKFDKETLNALDNPNDKMYSILFAEPFSPQLLRNRIASTEKNDLVAQKYSSKDKEYARMVLNLPFTAMESRWTMEKFEKEIQNLEEKILSEQWTDEEFLAQSMIAVLKHSTVFHKNRSQFLDKKGTPSQQGEFLDENSGGWGAGVSWGDVCSWLKTHKVLVLTAIDIGGVYIGMFSPQAMAAATLIRALGFVAGRGLSASGAADLLVYNMVCP